MRSFARCIWYFLLCTFALPANAELTITVKSGSHDLHNAPVTVMLKPAKGQDPNHPEPIYLTSGGEKSAIPCQVTPESGMLRLTFLVADLPKGKQRVYHRARGSQPHEYAPAAVDIKPNGTDLDCLIGGKLFTAYTTHSGPNKPFFYPILTPDGQHMTRRWPVEPDALPGESHDHPHHRGLWFTHSSVNGVDFWMETDTNKQGRTINVGFPQTTSGPVYGGFQAQTEWRMPDNKLIATDTRNVRIYALPNNDRILDFEITLKPVGGPLTFGDNKDGTFGLRVPDVMAITPDRSSKFPGKGHIETSAGIKDKDAWGKRADWVDYWGPLGEKVYGVAIFDAPTNLRHPTTWHARDYSLFTANPFGLHDFGLGAKGVGDYTVPLGEQITFRYRVLFHQGDTTAAHVADQYAAFADPPEVSAHW
ncbi:MAG TPA: PmoA family protein [Chthonomonadaceae bacterium]|nr:PmoA family protein [Chthonomonadaceae bacterium]